MTTCLHAVHSKELNKKQNLKDQLRLSAGQISGLTECLPSLIVYKGKKRAADDIDLDVTINLGAEKKKKMNGQIGSLM